jgi:hypothetical protein
MTHRSKISWLAVCCLCVGVMIMVSVSSGLSEPQIPAPRFIIQVGPGLWMAGLTQFTIHGAGADTSWSKQRRENWCWAASIQSVLNMAGVAVTQEQVVERIYGGDLDMGGTAQDILNALTGWAPTFNGRVAQLHPLPLVNDADMVDDLSLGWPLIVGLRNPDGSGHAEVVTAVTYAVAPDNSPIFQSVVLRNPWPEQLCPPDQPCPSRAVVSWQEFTGRREFVIRNRVTYPNGL